jgi:hypothetical protein
LWFAAKAQDAINDYVVDALSEDFKGNEVVGADGREGEVG